MPTNFPTSLDNFSNPTAGDKLNTSAVTHTEQHTNNNDAVEALEARVGITGSAVATSHDKRLALLEAGAIEFSEVDGAPAILRKKLRLPNDTLTDVDADMVAFTPLLRRLADVLFTTYAGLAGRVLQVKADESGVEAVAPYDLVSLSTLLALTEDAGQNRVTLEVRPVPWNLTFNYGSTFSTAVPTSPVEMPNTQRRKFIDLTYATQARLVVRVVDAYSAGTQFAAQYSTDQTTWNYLDAASGPVVGVTSANTTQVSAWVNVTALAKADVYLRIVGLNGDSTTTARVVGTIDVQFK